MTNEKTGGPAFPVHGGNADDDPPMMPSRMEDAE
jgi:hypothetical protein